MASRPLFLNPHPRRPPVPPSCVQVLPSAGELPPGYDNAARAEQAAAEKVTMAELATAEGMYFSAHRITYNCPVWYAAATVDRFTSFYSWAWGSFLCGCRRYLLMSPVFDTIVLPPD